MKLFQRYVPSVEEDKRDKADRAKRIGLDLFVISILFAIISIGILCGGQGRYSYNFYPHMRRFDVISSCIGLAWAAVLSLYYFLMKPATRKKLVVMYVLDTLTVCLLSAYFLVGAYTAHIGRFPDMPFTLGDFLFEELYALPFVVYFPVSHLICYRKSKLSLID